MRNMRYAAPQTVPVENFCHVENIFILKKNYESWKWKHPTCFVILNTAMTQCQMSGIGSRMTDIQTASKRNVELGRGGEAQSWKLTIISTFCNLTLFWIFLTNMLWRHNSSNHDFWPEEKFVRSEGNSAEQKGEKNVQPRKLWVISTSGSVCRIHSNNCTRPPWRTRTEKKQLKDV